MRREAVVSVLVAALQGCAEEPPGCLGASDRCVPPRACRRLSYPRCEGGFVRVRRVSGPQDRPPGLRAEATLGDLLLENDRLLAVVDALDHPHHLGLTGGTLIDLAPRGGEDHLNQVAQIAGILPRDGARYTSLTSYEDAQGAHILARGHLDASASLRIVTRYDLRPCEPGVRVRTELYNGSRDTWTWHLGDAWWWGDRGVTPFVPLRGQGFHQPELDLVEIDGAWREFPWVAAQSHLDPDAAYATVSCNRESLSGVHSATISSSGTPRTLVAPGDGLAFERMLLVAPGRGLAGAADLALDARERLFGERSGVIQGRVLDMASPPRPLGGDERAVSLLFYEPARGPDPDLETGIRPWTEVVPDAEGLFSVRVPAARDLRVRPFRLGRPLGPALAVNADLSMQALTLPRAPTLSVQVRLAPTDTPVHAEVILVPTDPGGRAGVEGTTHGYFARCAPYLGPAHGRAPGCNRALAWNGRASFGVSPGRYHVYAHAGPTHTLAREEVTITEGMNATVSLRLNALVGLYPDGVLSADFHVHGGRSFDIAFPDRDRVMTFVTAGVQVIAATDHDVVTDFADAVRDLGVGSRVRVFPGAETTPEIPWLYVPHPDGRPRGPKVIGHFIFWPIPVDLNSPGNGLPWDELLEPGALFDRVRARMSDRGVIQLNHPMHDAILLRDLGYPRTLGLDLRRPLPPGVDDGTAEGRMFARPGGATGHRNSDWDAQEAMQGADVLNNLRHRQLWHYLLNIGMLRAGTANSDSHSLAAEQLGYPRNHVLGVGPLARMEPTAFNTAVREGRLVGGNGAFIDASIEGSDGAPRGPSLVAFSPRAGASLRVAVTAPPWVPVREVRVLVNGRVVRTVTGDALRAPADPFAADGVSRYTGSFPLQELLGGRDGWLVVEAGDTLLPAADTDNDGTVDRIDGDGDGQIDDEEPRDAALTDPGYHLQVVSPGQRSFAFTNPFLLDVDGNGWTAPGLGGAR
ncbi:MAG: PHP domain-containing protein [Deltaproteobacteria bacterium]|nr:PHP domain-containing protein [Deltaproteobacteria bacterium]